MRISIFGLGKIGRALTGVYASMGHEVIGYDIKSLSLEDILQEAEISPEPQLLEYLVSGQSRISVTADADYAVSNSQVTVIIVPTPSEANGYFSNSYVLDALTSISNAANRIGRKQTVILKSTVMPRSCQSFQKMFERDLTILYNPEFIAQGSIVADVLKPKQLLLGYSDSASKAEISLAENLLRSIVPGQTKINQMSFESVEIAKIAINSYVTMKIAFGNQLDEYSRALENSNSLDIFEAVGSDPRIGHSYMRPGLGFGGPCFPRDNEAFASALEAAGLEPNLQQSTIRENKLRLDAWKSRLESHISKEVPVGFVGISYKFASDILEGSHSFELATFVAITNPVFFFDPAVEELSQQGLTKVNSLEELAELTAILFVGHKEYLCEVQSLGKRYINPWI